MMNTNTPNEDVEDKHESLWRGLSSKSKIALAVAAVITVACAVAIPLAIITSENDSVSTDAKADSGDDGSNEEGGGVSQESASESLALEPSTGCNRFVHLCSKRFDEVAQAALHNAFATEAQGFSSVVVNQVKIFSSGLLAGARTLMLDCHLIDAETIKVCHFSCAAGSLDVRDTLDTIAEFLELNPREIVTVMWETQVVTEDAGIETLKRLLTETAQASRLAPFLNVQLGAEDAWPTLEEMIARNQRLVWFVDRSEGTLAPWDLDLWDYVVETPYSNRRKSDLEGPCAFNRGTPANALFLLNHFISPPDPAAAAYINSNPFLLERAERCAAELGRQPNFIAVDFHSSSDVFAAVNALNDADASA